MAFTLKAIQTARTKRSAARGPLLRQQQNIPAVPAGPKNSNGPKGGSSQTKTRVPHNSVVPKVSKPGRQNPAVNKGKTASTRRSTRINYRMLRTVK